VSESKYNGYVASVVGVGQQYPLFDPNPPQGRYPLFDPRRPVPTVTRMQLTSTAVRSPIEATRKDVPVQWPGLPPAFRQLSTRRPSFQRPEVTSSVLDLRIINGKYYYTVVQGDTIGLIVYKAFGTIMNDSERESRGNQLVASNPAIRIGTTLRTRPLTKGELLLWPGGWPLQLRYG